MFLKMYVEIIFVMSYRLSKTFLLSIIYDISSLMYESTYLKKILVIMIVGFRDKIV